MNALTLLDTLTLIFCIGVTVILVLALLLGVGLDRGEDPHEWEHRP